MRIITKETKEQIPALYNTPLTLSQVAEKLGITKNTVFMYLKSKRLLRNYRLGSDEKLKDSSILSREEYKKKYNCSDSSYYNFKQRHESKDYELANKLKIKSKYLGKIPNKSLMYYEAISSGMTKKEFDEKFGITGNHAYYRHRSNYIKLVRLSKQ